MSHDASFKIKPIRDDGDKKSTVTFYLGVTCDASEQLIFDVFVVGGDKVGNVDPVTPVFGGIQWEERIVELDFSAIDVGDYSVVVKTLETGLINKAIVVIYQV